MKLRKVIEELQVEVVQLSRELSEFRKWKNSLDWNKHKMERLECIVQDADKVLQCFHDWRYMHILNDRVIFHCERCGGIQRRTWSDLTEQEIKGLAMLGINKPEGSNQ